MLRVLGPLTLDGVVLGSARQRRLLAALALRPGESVPADRLAWGARSALQTQVARLRRLLPADLVIETTPAGYRLRGPVDAVEFAGHVEAGRWAAALELWRGEPYPELEPTPEAARLAELHRWAVEQRGAELTAGRPAEAVALLEALVRAEPLRERAVALLMRALAGAGRQADALAAYDRVRRALAEELGVDPSAPLREAYEQVLRQEPVRRSALPSSLVGRTAELERGRRMLAAHRVVTVTGTGGVGKTRLARELAAEVPDVLLVELADGGPADVVPTLAGALRITDPGRIVEVLAARPLVLVLDNCEHVVDEVAALAERLVAGTPVTVLATSREALRIDGEHVLPLAPLPAADAARLLTDRIRAGDPTADPPSALVEQVCARLDGLPLALELAAARAVPLGLEAVAAGFAADLRGGRRTAAARHRSLQAVVDWSYRLLEPGQAALFARMAVFAAPVEPAAVDRVCGGVAALPDLVEKSLVVRRGGRFGMLETLRAFGRERTAGSAEATELRVRHARWAVDLAVELRAARRGPGEAAAVRRFDEHLPDLRRAHEWIVGHGPLGDLAPLTTLFAELGYLRCRADLVRTAEAGVAALGVRAPEAVYQLANACWQRGDLDRAAELADALFAAGASAYGHEIRANLHSFRGETDAAMASAAAAAEGARALGDAELETAALVDLLVAAAYGGRLSADDADGTGPAPTGPPSDSAVPRPHVPGERALPGAFAAVDDAVARAGNPTSRAFAAYARGEVLAERGDPEARRHLREAVERAEEVDSAFVAGVARHTLLTAAARAGDAPLVELRPLLEHWHRVGSWTQLWVAVRALVEALSRLGGEVEAGTLLGALRASPRATPAYGADLERERAVERRLRARIDLDAALAAGAALGDAEAFALAMRVTTPPGDAG